jgi:hypothetical protein
MNTNTVSMENIQIMRNFIRGFEEFQQIIRGEKKGRPVRDSLEEWQRWADEVEEEEKLSLKQMSK